MDIVYIAIGNELLNGKIQDKNAFWLAQACHKNGHHFQSAHLIPDHYEEFEKVLNLYQNSKTLIITSGGLGPTKDDLTKNYLSKYFDSPLEFNQQALEIVSENYKQKDRIYNREYKYEYIPAKFTALSNTVGFAPGLKFETHQFAIISLPGVPREFNQMITDHIEKANTQNDFHLIFKTKDLGETKIFNELEPNLWEELAPYGQVASLPHTLSVDISIKLNDIKTKDEVIALMSKTKIFKNIWHIGSESLEEVIIAKAQARGLTFGFAESCTGGLLASRITDISGSSSVFFGNVCAYDNSVKQKVLNVKPHTLDSYGAVSTQTATEMASGAREALGVDIVISTTGIAGPGGGSEDKPIGTVCIGFATKNRCESQRYNFSGNRIDLKDRFAQKALFTLLETIENY